MWNSECRMSLVVDSVLVSPVFLCIDTVDTHIQDSMPYEGKQGLPTVPVDGILWLI